MISYDEIILWLDAEQSRADSVSIERLREVLNKFDDQDGIGIESVRCWQPDERSVTLDVSAISDESVDIVFTTTDSMETMYLALGSMLRHHYSKQLEKLPK